jgi:hypothetical protein
MIIFFFVICAVAGVLLGLRCKVFALVPATLVAAAVVIASSREPAVTIVFTVLGTFSFLQIGFFVGCSSRSSVRDLGHMLK